MSELSALQNALQTIEKSRRELRYPETELANAMHVIHPEIISDETMLLNIIAGINNHPELRVSLVPKVNDYLVGKDVNLKIAKALLTSPVPYAVEIIHAAARKISGSSLDSKSAGRIINALENLPNLDGADHKQLLDALDQAAMQHLLEQHDCWQLMTQVLLNDHLPVSKRLSVLRVLDTQFRKGREQSYLLESFKGFVEHPQAEIFADVYKVWSTWREQNG